VLFVVVVVVEEESGDGMDFDIPVGSYLLFLLDARLPQRKINSNLIHKHFQHFSSFLRQLK
jgi:hypothetical protein